MNFITSIAILFISGFSASLLFKKINMPGIIGYLLAGIIVGPCLLNVLDSSILAISPDIRKIALIIILIKAGLSLDIKTLKSIGRPAIFLSFLPALFEIGGTVLLAPLFLPVTRLEAAIIGSILGAVSPAVVVPKMVDLMDENLGTEKKIPQLILAGSSLDDVFVIILFTVFVNMESGVSVSPGLTLLKIPVSIITGIFLGYLAGIPASLLFKKFKGSTTVKAVILLSFAFLIESLEGFIGETIPFSGLLAVMAMAVSFAEKSETTETENMKDSFGRFWIPAEILLFTLVGAAVNIEYTLKAGPKALFLILILLIVRSLGTLVSLTGTNLNRKERLFTVFSYLPKATVQAAIGGIPLAMGLNCGNTALSISVLSILVTAPLGATLMDKTSHKLLKS